MSSEKTLRKNVLEILRAANLDPHAVENLCAKGMPDVECTRGWIELKEHHGWPKDPQRVVTLDHPVSNEQRIWLRRRCKSGGKAWLLLQVDREFLLFKGTDAGIVGNGTRADLEMAAQGRAADLATLRTYLPLWLLN